MLPHPFGTGHPVWMGSRQKHTGHSIVTTTVKFYQKFFDFLVIKHCTPLICFKVKVVSIDLS